MKHSDKKFSELPILMVDDDIDVLDTQKYILNSNGIINIIQCSDNRDVPAI